MARRRTRRNGRTSATRTRSSKIGSWLRNFLPAKRTLKQGWKKYRRAQPRTQIVIGVVTLFVSWFAVNWLYQVARKPTELFFPVSGTLNKSPQETWRSYESIFRKHSTAVITPDLLAALAQIEGSGNPVARTYWRWSLTDKPFEVYKPASSAVGMYQITSTTFDAARRFCIHDHEVIEDGHWYEWRSCWFNSLYFRVLPTHAVELTSAFLDRQVAMIIEKHRLPSPGLKQKQMLATLIHLCGAGAGARYARRGFRLLPLQKCGDHNAAAYLNRVANMQEVFARWAKSE